MSQWIRSQLAVVRRRSILVESGAGLCVAVCAFVLILAAGMWVDWKIELSYGVRAVLLLINLAVAGGIVVRWVIFPALYSMDDDELALRIERWHPPFQTRLIAAVQLSRPRVADGTSAALVRALVDETESLARAIAFERVVAVDPLLRAGGLAMVVVLGGLLALGYGRAATVPLLQRALLVPNVPVPRKTQVVIHDGDKVVARGETVVLSAAAQGVIPTQGTVTLGYKDGRAQDFVMDADDESPGSFQRRVDNVQQSFSYVVKLNDGTSQSYTVAVADRPTVSELKIRQIYPAYTGLGTVARAPGDLTLLAGSRLELDITASKRLKPTAAQTRDGNFLHLDGADLEMPLTVSVDNPSRLTVSHAGAAGFVVPDSTTGLSINLVDQDGLRSVDPVVYRVQMQPDRPPSVRVTYPIQREELLTQQATLIAGFEAADDFALGRVALRYKIRQVDSSAVKRANGEPDGAGDGLSATYYNELGFKGREFKRIDPQIDFDWGGGAPAPGIGADRFTVRWEGQIRPRYTQAYTFIMQADDGCRLWVNGKLLIDQFPGQYDREHSGSISLSADTMVPIRVEMMEQSVAANVHLWWSSASQEREIVPRARLFSQPGEIRPFAPESPALMALGGDGVQVTYFAKPDLTGHSVTATLPQIDLIWDDKQRPTGIPKNFSARMTGYFIPRYDGLYTIQTAADKGLRLWIDDQLLIDQWKGSAREQSVSIPLRAGTAYALKYEYHNGGGGRAMARLRWSSEQQLAEPIPQERLFTTKAKAQAAVARFRTRQTAYENEIAEVARDDPDARTILIDMAGTPRTLRGHYKLDLSTLSPAPPVGSIIEWWVQALDTNDVTGPGKSVSDHFLARIVTPEVKRAELLNQAADTLDQMRGVTQSQEQLNQRLGDLLTGRPESP